VARCAIRPRLRKNETDFTKPASSSDALQIKDFLGKKKITNTDTEKRGRRRKAGIISDNQLLISKVLQILGVKRN